MAHVAGIDGLRVRWPADGDGEGAIALDGVSLTVEAGEILGIVGETGSGRSTLVRSLNGIVPRLVRAEVEGQIVVAGLSPSTTSVPDMARMVTIVLDDPETQMTQATAGDEVAFGLENLGLAPDEIRDRVTAALADVGLGGFEGRDPLTLSGGEQQRLAVAAAVAMRPRLLVMDEPTANLDPASARRLFELVQGVAAADDGPAVVIVANDTGLLAEYADRVAWLEDGRIRALGTPAEVFTAMAREADATLAPAVTELCSRLDATATDLPVTVAAAAAWLGGSR
jgi:energy-coupling factor transport system ATP-binding protein